MYPSNPTYGDKPVQASPTPIIHHATVLARKELPDEPIQHHFGAENIGGG